MSFKQTKKLANGQLSCVMHSARRLCIYYRPNANSARRRCSFPPPPAPFLPMRAPLVAPHSSSRRDVTRTSRTVGCGAREPAPQLAPTSEGKCLHSAGHGS
ncbi:hypothetical protein Zmor_015560 [Zophobas morio]|uniref:Uncharacterized protein n=1 Tax=Zophobas morio TaxID=2755281 RepID=A0AA38IMB2_9CUCU|nr:hypothetical protein Zmor_015560 [Zophobas morio]